MKKALLVLLGLGMSLSLAGCAANGSSVNEPDMQAQNVREQTSSTPVIDDDTDYYDGVKLIKLDPRIGGPNADACFVPTSDDLLYSQNEFLISGSVQSFSEVKLGYSYEGASVEDYMTIIDFKINDVVYKSADADYSAAQKIAERQTVSLGLPYNSHYFIDSLPVIKNGTEFLVLCKSTANMKLQNETQRLSSFVDFWCSAPQCMLFEKINECYLADNYFQTCVSSGSVFEFSVQDNGRLIGMNNDNNVIKAFNAFKERVGNPSNAGFILKESCVLIECEALESAIAGRIDLAHKGLIPDEN